MEVLSAGASRNTTKTRDRQKKPTTRKRRNEVAEIWLRASESKTIYSPKRKESDKVVTCAGKAVRHIDFAEDLY